MEKVETKSDLRPGKDLELRIHDGLIGVVIILGIGLGMVHNPNWYWLSAATGAIMISSSFTGFCPLHFVLGKMLKKKG